MAPISRRSVIKGGLAIPATGFLSGSAVVAVAESMAVQSTIASAAATQRERLLLDFGWRFHFGNADDPTKDFGFGSGRTREFQKTGNFLPVAALAFDDSDWKALDLPHDWAIELPFKNDPALSSKGFYPLGRTYPATSVGWYRRVFEIPPKTTRASGSRSSSTAPTAKRWWSSTAFTSASISGGYDPFSFDVTDFANPGRKQCAAGARGCHVERWLVLRGRGNLPARLAGEDASGACEAVGHVRALRRCRPAEATLSIRTEVDNDGKHAAERARDLDGSRSRRARRSAKTASTHRRIADGDEQTYEQESCRQRPALWSLERAESLQAGDGGRSGGDDRRSLRNAASAFARLRFDAEKGFFLNGKPVKVKGTCNHQDHAGLGAALPDAVQYLPRSQAAGDGLQRLSHLAQSAHAGAARCLRRAGHAGLRRDAHDVVESRRPEPVRESGAARPQSSQRLHVVDGQRRRPGEHRERACTFSPR